MSHRPRVFVCDHEPLSAVALQRVLRDAGFDVDVTSSAADALERATVRVPDALIVELRLQSATVPTSAAACANGARSR